MKALLKMYRGLPKELKTVIAMAGLGSPIGALYLLRRFMFPNTPLIFLIFGLIAVVVVICVIGFLISRLLGRGKRKRSQKMAQELAGDGGGQVSMDVAAAIKTNNEKFFSAIKDMRRNLHVNIYDLPWYIVIGDSGCGKTKLVNAGGLQFSAGKPEGYTLGTLNYNWWFTEDAIFIDMAGRLVNPREDSDRREWEAFLNTIAKGRKGFPINGALVCVSAEHLLADPPEKIEQDANTMLERLRDIQTKLGVTFACYLVVTKCDKIVGFMQFFDRAGRDITVLNQMVGWSKPGEFNELYDPEDFPKDFGHVYHRLHELRLRRLQDEAEEQDLGLAYSFPEEFREIMHPLQTYVRTLFPKIKNPRAMKNLIFRGTYFTSATQEGSLILKHLQERLGAEAAEQFAPLDLYPTKRTYFIKDLLFRKVFPEHGLVFRNEQDVIRNRRLAKFLKVGSVALAAVLITFVVISSSQFRKVIGEPRASAQEADPWHPPAEASVIKVSDRLHGGVRTLREKSLWATLLSLGIGTDEPIVNLKTIQAAVFEEALREALRDVSRSLREPGYNLSKASPEQAKQYKNALAYYIRWYGCAAEDSSWGAQIDKDGLSAMCDILNAQSSPNSIIGPDHRESFDKHAAIYFSNAAEHGGWRSPARVLTDPNTGADPQETIATAMKNVRQVMAQHATLNAGHPNPVIKEWMRICDNCRVVDESYDNMLDAGGDVLEGVDMDALKQFQDAFGRSYGRFDESLQGCRWSSEEAKMLSLRDAIYKERDIWVDYRDRLVEELGQCGSDGEALAAVRNELDSIVVTGATTVDAGLDQLLWKNLYDAKLADQEEFKPEYFASVEAFKKVTRELYEPYRHIVQLTKESEAAVERLELAPPTRPVASALSDINDALSKIKFTASDSPGVVSDWVDELARIDRAFFEKASADEQSQSVESELAAIEDRWTGVWRTADLGDLYKQHNEIILLGQGRNALLTVRNALEEIDPGDPWAIASEYDDYGASQDSTFYIERPVSDDDRRPTRRATPREDDSRQRRSGRFRRGRRGRVGSQDPAAPARRNLVMTGEQSIPRCASQQFLSDLAMDSADLLELLDLFGQSPALYLSDPNEAVPLHRQCSEAYEESVRKYMQQYVTAWSNAYEKHRLRAVNDLLEDSTDWDGLVTRLGDRARGGHVGIATEVGNGLNEILNSIAFWGWFEDAAGIWQDPRTDTRDTWLRVLDWMRSAINDRWRASPDGAEFPGDTTKPPEAVLHAKPRGAPSEAIAAEVAARFSSLAEQLVANKELPKEFKDLPKERETEKRRIKWKQLQEIVNDARLSGEKFTGQLLELERTAQEYLNERLTNTLHEIQERHFPGRQPWRWPYLDNPATADKVVLDTVNFKAFTDFLKEVGYAEAYFKPLEEGFSTNDEQYQKRQKLYRQCRQWHEFLGLERRSNRELKIVEIEWFDPKSGPGRGLVRGGEPDDTAQNFYLATELSIGVKVKFPEDSGFTPKPIKVPTRPLRPTDRTAEAIWDWPAGSGTDDMVFELLDGRALPGLSEFAPVKEAFGSTSALALCGYLESGRSLEGDRRKWAKVHVIDLASKMESKGHRKHSAHLRQTNSVNIGLGYKFTLDRPIPEAIEPIQAAGSSRSASR